MKMFSRSFWCFWLLWSLLGTARGALPTASPQYVEGDVIVTFKSSVDLTNARQTLAIHSLAFKRHFAGLSRYLGKHTGLVHDSSRTTVQLIVELSRDPAVELVEPNYLRWVNRLPNDTFFTNQWALQNTGQLVNGTSGTAGADLHFVNAWALTRPATNPVIVAVIDTGVDYTHPDLFPNIWTNPGEIPDNGLDDDGNGYVDDFFGYDFADDVASPDDSGYHGTHVAGIIAAVGNNQLGIIGVDYQAKIMALKVSSDGSTINTSAEIEALDYAAMMKGRGNNIVVINASYGGGGSNSTEVAAIAAVGAAGIIFCAAAGNNSTNNDITPEYPASYRLTNMIVVAATDQNDQLASFSDYGSKTVDLGAPGVNIYSAYPTYYSTPFCSATQGASTFAGTPLTFAGSTTGYTGPIYDCGLGYPTNFPSGVTNYIALIDRGTLNFSVKVNNAMAAGAGAAIVYNNVAGTFNGTLEYPVTWIPAISIAQADGQTLKAALPAIGSVVNDYDQSQIYQYLDGTSMATPQVSGAVAFAAMNFPTETVAQRIQRVLTNVDVVAGLVGKVRTGGRLDLQRIVDTDLNGLPDWWEFQYFGHYTGTNPNADPDHDGMSNYAEWVAGTNPTNAASALRLTMLSVTNLNQITLAWSSVAGKSYWLESSTNLLTGFNVLIGTNLNATAPTNIITDTNNLPYPSRFYRLGVEQ